MVGVVTVGDLLRYYPRRHEDYTDIVDVCFLQEEAKQTVRVRVEQSACAGPCAAEEWWWKRSSATTPAG